jgi:hypothetical protein
MQLYLSLRPAFAPILGHQQGANNSRRLDCAEIGAGAERLVDRLIAFPFNEQSARDIQSAIAGEIEPTPAILLACPCHIGGNVRSGKNQNRLGVCFPGGKNVGKP